MVSLRERNRLNAMRLTQRTALPLFVERGFGEVTIAEIADEVGMAASTIYRHFKTKEEIVLWDEHDPAIERSLVEKLKTMPPFAAVRDAFVETLGGRYDADLDFQLVRVKFIFATEAVHAAAVEADFRNRAELTTAFERFLSRKNRASAPILSGAAMIALDVALDRWQQLDAKQPLGSLIADAFESLADLSSLR